MLVLADEVVVLELDAVAVTVTEVLDPLLMMQPVLLLLHDGAKSIVGLGRRLRLLSSFAGTCPAAAADFKEGAAVFVVVRFKLVLLLLLY